MRLLSCMILVVLSLALAAGCARRGREEGVSPGSHPSARSGGARGTLGGAGDAAPLRNGVYPVLGEFATRDSAGAVAGSPIVLAYDRKYSEAGPKGDPTFVAIDSSA